MRGALSASNADGVMIGRGTYGRPWFPGQAAAFIETGRAPSAPTLMRQRTIALEHYHGMLSHYGRELGVRNARKHLGWYVENALVRTEELKSWRRRLCREDDPVQVCAPVGRLLSMANGGGGMTAKFASRSALHDPPKPCTRAADQRVVERVSARCSAYRRR